MQDIYHIDNHPDLPQLLYNEVYYKLYGLNDINIYINNSIQLFHGLLWITNYKCILKFNDISIFCIPHCFIFSFIKESKNNSFICTLYCRDLSIINIYCKISSYSKDIIKKLQYFCTLKMKKRITCFLYGKHEEFINGWDILSIKYEYKRQGFNINNWQIIRDKTLIDFNINPSIITLPRNFNRIISLSQIKINNRIHNLTWGSPRGSYLIRCSNFIPNISLKDIVIEQELLQVILEFSINDKLLLIDTCSYKDFPSNIYSSFYSEYCEIAPIGLPKKHDILHTFNLLRNIQCINEKSNIYKNKTLKTWLDYIGKILDSSMYLSISLDTGRTIIIQNTTGDNMLSILSSLSQILIDPFYRTIKGFCILIEKEFIQYNHDFGLMNVKKDDYSIYFILFLDCVYQIISQHPLAFQFDDELLYFIINEIYSCKYGTFIPQDDKQREKFLYTTTSLWTYIYNNEKYYINPFYKETNMLYIQSDNIYLRLWNRYFLRTSCKSGIYIAKKILYALKDHLFLDFPSLQIPYIPLSLPNSQYIKNIVKICFSDNLLTCIPIQILAARNLKILDFSRNYITNISDDIMNLLSIYLTNIEVINLNYNYIISLSGYISKIKYLKTLCISNNKLLSIPDISSLEYLTELDLSGNKLKDIPEYLYQNKNLKIFNISSNINIVNISDSICNLINLQDLNISTLSISHLPNDINHLTKLLSLNISDIPLKTIPKEIFSFSNITILSLYKLNLNQIPKEIEECKNITDLNLSYNHITNIPNHLLELLYLKYLNLSYNKLTYLPLDISKLVNLLELYINNNKLKALTPGIGNLQKLRVLNISYNFIHYIPATIGYMSRLEESHQFIFSNNNLITPPNNIIIQGNNAIFKYLQSLFEEYEKVYNIRLMILGNENVGKTLLINNLKEYINLGRKNTFNSNNVHDNIITTLDKNIIDISSLKYDVMISKDFSVSIDMIIWDFIGDSIYNSIYPFFITERGVYIIVWDITKNIDDSYIQYWIDNIKYKAPNSSILLVGTHIDDPICTKEYIDNTIEHIESKYCSKYPNIQGIRMIDNINNKGTEQLDLWIQAIILNQKYLGESIPSTYIELENMLKEEKVKRKPPILKWDEFKKLAYICNIRDNDILIKVAKYLHNIGSILYYSSKNKLLDIVFLDILWLLDIFSSIFTKKYNYIRNGFIDNSCLSNIWIPPQFSSQFHYLYFDILKRFELVYHIPLQQNDLHNIGLELLAGKSIIPLLLPKDRPPIEIYWSQYPNLNDKQFGREYLFKYLPQEAISCLFTRLLSIIEPTIFWKYGIIYEKNNNISNIYNEGKFIMFIQILLDKNIIQITIRGKPIPLIQNIYKIFDNIINELDLYCNIQIPCIHCIKEHKVLPYKFSLESCLLALNKRQKTILCSNINNIKLNEIIPDIYVKCNYQISYKNIKIIDEIENNNNYILLKGLYNNKNILIKEFKIDINKEDNMYNLMKSKIIQLCNMKHSNISQTIGYTIHPFCYITYYIDNISLYNIINNKNNKLSWRFRWRCALDIANGIRFLHYNQPLSPIIHKNLTSDNIIIESLDENAKIVAKIININISSKIQCLDIYLPPEVMINNNYSKSIDVYMYGIILYELALSTNFKDNILYKSLKDNSIYNGERPKLSKDIPKEFKTLIKDCWKQDYNERPSFEDIIKRLKHGIFINYPDLLKIISEHKHFDNNNNIIRKNSSQKLLLEETNKQEEDELELIKQQKLKVELNSLSNIIKPNHESSITRLLYVMNTGKQSSIWSVCKDSLNIWNINGKLLQTIPGYIKQVLSMLQVGDTVWILYNNNKIRIYNIKDMQIKKEIDDIPILCLELVGKSIWGGGKDSNIYIFDKIGKIKKQFLCNILNNFPIYCLCYIKSTCEIWAGTSIKNNCIIIFNQKGIMKDINISGHSKTVSCIIESNDYIWSCSFDKTIMIWTNQGQCIRLLRGHSAPIYCLFNTETHICSTSEDKKIIFWDKENLNLYKEYECHKDIIHYGVQIPENKHIWTCSSDKTIRIWNKHP